MKYKVVVMDMDDTLLTSSNEISPNTLSYLKKIQKEGIQLVLASGRPIGGMVKHAKSLLMDQYNGYIVSYNGAYILDAKDESVIYEELIDLNHFKDLIDYCRENDFFYLTYKDNHIIYDSEHEYMHIESELTGLPMKKVEDVKSYITTPVPKVMGVDYEKNIAKAKDDLNGSFNEAISSTMSKPMFLEFMNNKVSKGKSLERLFSKLNINMDEVIAFGDSLNDYDMLHKVGVGVAMDNANDTIKDIADMVTDDNDSDGIINALEKILNSNR